MYNYFTTFLWWQGKDTLTGARNSFTLTLTHSERSEVTRYDVSA